MSARFFEVLEATWPPASKTRVGPFTLRDGAGGGKRVSATTCDGVVQAEALPAAEAAMSELGQPALFMLRDGADAFDATLEDAGYRVLDASNIYLAPVAPLAEAELPRVGTYTIWEPLEIMRDIWAAGGIGPERIAVMERATCTKTGLFGRLGDRPAAAGFIGLHGKTAMVHALEVLERDRRCGLGRLLMRRAARWARSEGATELAVICTAANEAANALYTSLGFTLVEQYHYRIKG